jgi:hypothetical protein
VSMYLVIIALNPACFRIRRGFSAAPIVDSCVLRVADRQRYSPRLPFDERNHSLEVVIGSASVDHLVPEPGSPDLIARVPDSISSCRHDRMLSSSIDSLFPT